MTRSGKITEHGRGVGDKVPKVLSSSQSLRASPRPDMVAGGLVGVSGLSRQKLHISAYEGLAEALKPQKRKTQFFGKSFG